MDFIKIKNFCCVKGTVKRMRGQANVGEKIFVNRIYDSELVSRTYKEFIKLNCKKTNNSTNNRFEKTLHQRYEDAHQRYTDSKEALEKMFNIISTREMQIKTMVRYHYISSRMAKIRILIMPKSREDAEQLEVPSIYGGKPRLVVTLENSLAVSFKVKHVLIYDFVFLLLGIYPGEMKTYVHTKTCM